MAEEGVLGPVLPSNMGLYTFSVAWLRKVYWAQFYPQTWAYIPQCCMAEEGVLGPVLPSNISLYTFSVAWPRKVYWAQFYPFLNLSV